MSLFSLESSLQALVFDICTVGTILIVVNSSAYTINTILLTKTKEDDPCKDIQMALNPITIAGNATSNYTHQYDGKGGINYFQNGKPITNTEYQKATGQNTNALEADGAINGFGQTPQTPKNPFSNTLQNVSSQYTSPSETTGINSFTPKSTSSYYTPPTTYLGKVYDQSDPAQVQALLEAKQQNLGGQRDQQIGQINRSLDNNLQDAALQQGNKLGELNLNAAQYGRSLLSNINNLGQGHDLGLINNQQQFSSLSPNAFQSAQGTSQQFANDQFAKGTNELHQGQLETVGGDYLRNGTISDNSVIGSKISALNGQYNRFTDDARNSAQLGIQGANNAYGSGMDQNLSNIQSLYNYAGLPQFKYDNQQYNPNALPGVDISKYTPYSNSAQLGKSPQAQGTNPAQWTGSSNPYSALLGYNPNASQSNYYNAFMNPGSSNAAQSTGG